MANVLVAWKTIEYRGSVYTPQKLERAGELKGPLKRQVSRGIQNGNDAETNLETGII